MAILHGPIDFTGKIGKLSAYKSNGKTILRSAGGPTKEQIATLASMEITRLRNAEFGGRSTGSAFMKRGMHTLKDLADKNLSGRLNALLGKLQQLDTEGEFGRRSICLRKGPHLAEGFELNESMLFDSIVRSPVKTNISLHEGLAAITIPPLEPNINFFTPKANYPLYCFTRNGSTGARSAP